MSQSAWYMWTLYPSLLTKQLKRDEAWTGLFKPSHKFWIGLTSGLWLCSSTTDCLHHFCNLSCTRLLSCWETNKQQVPKMWCFMKIMTAGVTLVLQSSPKLRVLVLLPLTQSTSRCSYRPQPPVGPSGAAVHWFCSHPTDCYFKYGYAFLT